MQNATYKRVADAAECTNVFRQGWLNRTRGQTDFETRTAVFFSLDLSMVSDFNKEIKNTSECIVELYKHTENFKNMREVHREA